MILLLLLAPLDAIESLGGTVSKLSKKGDGLEVDLRDSRVKDADLKHLAELGKVEVLRLGGTAITDEGLKHVGALASLKRLHLERTAISDAGLKHLLGHKELETLNLFGTAITDVKSLKELPRLRLLIITETKATGIAALRRPGLSIIPDPATEREQAEAALAIALSAREHAEKKLAALQKEAADLAPRAAQLKKEADALKRELDKLPRGSAEAKPISEKYKIAQRDASRAGNAKKNAEEAVKHVEAYKQAETEARRRLASLGG